MGITKCTPQTGVGEKYHQLGARGGIMRRPCCAIALWMMVPLLTGAQTQRADLAKHEGGTLGSVMSQTPGLAVMNGSGGQAWVTARHAPSSQCLARDTLCIRRERLYYIPLRYEAFQGMKRACYARVYMDRM